MFRINEGKFIGENISFIPPKDFYLVVRQSEFYEDGLKFISANGIISITITFERHSCSAEEVLEELLNTEGCRALSEIQKVYRAVRPALSLYYTANFSSVSCYKEIYDFRINKFCENQVCVTVELQQSKINNSTGIYTVLGMPQVKAFFDSLHFHGK